MYSIKIHTFRNGEELVLPGLEDIKIIFITDENSLCPSNYNDNIRCFWEGDLSVTLNANGMNITINDHDKKNNTTHEIMSHGKIYKFQGTAAEVINKSRDETYLLFDVHYYDNSLYTTDSSTSDNIIVRLGETFKIELFSNATTGYHWDLNLSDGLRILSHNYILSPEAKQGMLGSGGKEKWLIQAARRGIQSISGTYLRSWEKDKPDPSYHARITVI